MSFVRRGGRDSGVAPSALSGDHSNGYSGREARAGGWRLRRIALWMLKLVAMAVFLYAALPKIADPRAFLADVEAYRVLPAFWMSAAVVTFLPWFELWLALGLWVRGLSRASAWSGLLLMLAFTGLLLSAWFRGLDIACGCFGQSEATGKYGWWLIRDLLLIANFGLILLLERKPGTSRKS